MPWGKRKGGGSCNADQWAVINTQTGDTKGCHNTKDQADSQLAALNANVKETPMPEAPPATTLTESRALTEASGQPDNRGRRMRIRLIDSGWGSSGYYSPEVLQEAARKRVFPSGLHMYLDHPTATESMERPERSVRDLAAVLTSDAVYRDGGLDADVTVLAEHRPVLAEMKDHIGVSIRGSGTVEQGQADGKTGQIITSLDEAASVDFVTHAGRGGRITQLLESAQARLREGHGMTANDLRKALRHAVDTAHGGQGTFTFVVDHTDEWVVFEAEGDGELQLMRQNYTISDGAATLTGEPQQVQAHTTYVPAGSPPPAQPPLQEGNRNMGHTGTETGVNPGGNEPTSREEQLQRQLDETRRERDDARQQVSTIGENAQRAQLAEQRANQAEADRDRLRGLIQARDTIDTRLAETDLPEASHPRVRSVVCGNEGSAIPLTESGSVDQERLDSAITAAVESERTYIARLAESAGAGLPRGLGETGGDNELTEADLESRLADGFQQMGLSETAAKTAAKGR